MPQPTPLDIIKTFVQTVGWREKEEAKMKRDGQKLTCFLKESEEAGLQKQLIIKYDLCPRLNINSSYSKMV